MTSNPASPTRLPWQSILHGQLQTAIVIIVCIILTVTTFLLLRNAEEDKLQTDFKKTTSAYHALFNAKLQRHIYETKSIRHFFAASATTVTRSEFQTFVTPLLTNNPDIEAFQWVPRIQTHEIQAYEQAARNDGLGNFSFKESSINGEINIYTHDYHFPVFYIEPLINNVKALGYDLDANIERLQTMQQARDCGCAVSTPRITLLQGTKQQYGFLIIVPVYANSLPYDSIKERQDNLLGFTVGVFRVKSIFESSIKNLSNNGINVQVIDKTDPNNQQLLYEHSEQTLPTNEQPNHQIEFNVAGRQWLLKFSATALYRQEHQQILPWIALAIGLMLSAILLLLLIANRRHQLASDIIANDIGLAKDKLEKASNAKSKFLSSMSHELRTPLNAILGFGQLLKHKSDNLTPNQLEHINHIILGGQQLLALIDDVLDLSKIENKVISITIEKTDIKDLLEYCLSMVTLLAVKYDITIKEDIFDSDIPLVLIDPKRFKQVILNLLSNAIKYNRKGGNVKINCSIINNSQMLRLFISDTGYGIAEEKHGELFMPFNRLGAESSNIDGTGIGLSITRELIELMQGNIGFKSIVDEGTTFWIDLPLADTDELSTDLSLPA